MEFLHWQTVPGDIVAKTVGLNPVWCTSIQKHWIIRLSSCLDTWKIKNQNSPSRLNTWFDLSPVKKKIILNFGVLFSIKLKTSWTAVTEEAEGPTDIKIMKTYQYLQAVEYSDELVSPRQSIPRSRATRDPRDNLHDSFCKARPAPANILLVYLTKMYLQAQY